MGGYVRSVGAPLLYLPTLQHHWRRDIQRYRKLRTFSRGSRNTFITNMAADRDIAGMTLPPTPPPPPVWDNYRSQVLYIDNHSIKPSG